MMMFLHRAKIEDEELGTEKPGMVLGEDLELVHFG